MAIFGLVFNHSSDNLPLNLKEIKIWKTHVNLYQMKIPFGCKVADENNMEIL